MPRNRKDKKDEGSHRRRKPAERPKTAGSQTNQHERGRPPRLGNPEADPVRIHREYVERHFESGGPATPKAYEEALRQWHQLPGSVSRPAPETAGQPEPPPEEETEGEQGDDRPSR
jgi:hypothetical protein